MCREGHVTWHVLSLATRQRCAGAHDRTKHHNACHRCASMHGNHPGARVLPCLYASSCVTTL